MGVILQVALPSRVLAAARLQCGAAGAGASRGIGVCAEHARLAARGGSARARGFPRVITAHTYAQPAPPLAPRSGRKFSPRVLNSVPNNLELYSSTR